MSPNQFTQKLSLEGVLHDSSLHSEKVSWGRELTWSFLNSELSSQLFDLGRFILVSVSVSLWTEGRASYSFNIKKMGHSSQWPSQTAEGKSVPSSFLKSPWESEGTAAYSAESAVWVSHRRERRAAGRNTETLEWGPTLEYHLLKKSHTIKNSRNSWETRLGAHWSWLVAVRSDDFKVAKAFKELKQTYFQYNNFQFTWGRK